MALHIETPYIESRPLSLGTGKSVWLKLEALQPTGSFKARGMGHACLIHKQHGAQRFISSSGGNAGLAVAYAGRQLKVPVTVVVPESTSERAKALIAMEKGVVVVHGKNWGEAHQAAKAMVDAHSVLLHPFDDPLLWSGHSTMIDEMVRQGPRPDAIILSVGGGGLLCGVIEGLQKSSWGGVPVVAVETVGADCLAQSLQAGEPVTLDDITTVATSLGARRACDRALDLSRSHSVESVVVQDRQAVEACVRFMDDHRLIVEPACGASLAALFSNADSLRRATTIAVVVCGGVGSTAANLAALHERLAESADTTATPS
ncbi:MAG TPA: pyridoxal-phosphate dependent enzyme [Burkholderiaceae bacterium]|nr:pyridoxal-phosphate dependent enzyme [Burkholderiaceae bacterium]